MAGLREASGCWTDGCRRGAGHGRECGRTSVLWDGSRHRYQRSAIDGGRGRGRGKGGRHRGGDRQERGERRGARELGVMRFTGERAWSDGSMQRFRRYILQLIHPRSASDLLPKPTPSSIHDCAWFALKSVVLNLTPSSHPCAPAKICSARLPPSRYSELLSCNALISFSLAYFRLPQPLSPDRTRLAAFQRRV